ncbi:hypothetical protein BWQ96_00502 [Gracilariopsis chorda]|uniref:Uncharacterized protein n=1 Tax=Gracilariopsis chorda TaxID=448386 RepID=A0A2V3J5H0_9FLOR|nr:hypothetical protein BWQ96_00502 [Gracilariopsis chorda]|eukprot:PXF49624.1 hypothetical protein BWQ96_00502 [Gracilariopsis chorda]
MSERTATCATAATCTGASMSLREHITGKCNKPQSLPSVSVVFKAYRTVGWNRRGCFASSAPRASTTTRRRRTFRGSAQAEESFEFDEDVGEKEFTEWFEEDAQESSSDEEEGGKEHEDIDDEDFDPLNYIAEEGLSSLDHDFNEANRASARRSCGTSGIPGTAQEERRKEQKRFSNLKARQRAKDALRAERCAALRWKL